MATMNTTTTHSKKTSAAAAGGGSEAAAAADFQRMIHPSPAPERHHNNNNNNNKHHHRHVVVNYDDNNDDVYHQQHRLVSRTSTLLHNKSFTDVTFIVGPASHSKKYVGHRVLLAMTSPVFEAMFYGDVSSEDFAAAAGGSSSKKVIRIPDLAPIGFENLLRYAYTDSLNLNGVEDAMLTAYAAKKYLLPHLLRECLSFIDRNVDPLTACSVLEFARSLHSFQLAFQALQVMDRQTYQVLSHPRTVAACQSATMATLASRPHLNLYSESSLITACVNWASAEAGRRRTRSSNNRMSLNMTTGRGQQQQQPQVTTTGVSDFATIRLVLQESGILRHLRFLSLTQEEFAKLVIATTTGVSSSTDASGGKDKKKKQDDDGGGDDDDDDGGLLLLTMTTHDYSSPSAASGDNQSNNMMIKTSTLLTLREQVSIFMNIAVPRICCLPRSLSSDARIRSSPPAEYYVVKRFPSSSSITSNVAATATSLSVLQQHQQQQQQQSSSSSFVRTAGCKFQVVVDDDHDYDYDDVMFIVGAAVPIRLDPSFYSVKTPRLDFALRFTSKPGISSSSSSTTGASARSQEPLFLDSFLSPPPPPPPPGESHHQMGGGVDECMLASSAGDCSGGQLTATLSKDKDCILRLKRPLVVKRGNLNEISVSLLCPPIGGHHHHVADDLVVVRSSVDHHHRKQQQQVAGAAAGKTAAAAAAAAAAEVRDAEGISWLFFKSPGGSIEFTELFYYY